MGSAIIVSNEVDFDFFKSQKDLSLILLSEVQRYFGNKEEQTTLLSYATNPFLSDDLASRIAQGWYRKNARSRMELDGICYGSLLQRNLRFHLSNLLRSYVVLTRLLENFDKVMVPNGFSIETELILEAFPKQLVSYNPSILIQPCNGISMPRGGISPVTVPWQSRAAHILQTPIRKFLKNRTVCVRDWAYQEKVIGSTNWLYQYHWNPFRSVFLQNPAELANNPPLLEQQVIVSNVLKILQKYFLPVFLYLLHQVVLEF